MTPDKIYINEDLINYYCLADHLNEEEITYIRKDALLEWAKIIKEEAEATCRHRTDNASYGQVVAMRDLINMLNSL